MGTPTHPSEAGEDDVLALSLSKKASQRSDAKQRGAFQAPSDSTVANSSSRRKHSAEVREETKASVAGASSDQKEPAKNLLSEFDFNEVLEPFTQKKSDEASERQPKHLRD